MALGVDRYYVAWYTRFGCKLVFNYYRSRRTNRSELASRDTCRIWADPNLVRDIETPYSELFLHGGRVQSTPDAPRGPLFRRAIWDSFMRLCSYRNP